MSKTFAGPSVEPVTLTIPESVAPVEPTGDAEPAGEVALLAEILAELVKAPEPAKRRGPRFGMCEGTRDELVRLGTAVDPFTGARLTRADLP